MTDGAGARILVVEDDRATADLVALYLRHDGHRVHVEHDGARALDRAAEERFDLLVLDVMLPGVDGLEICRRVRADGPTPVILVTARTREEDRVVGLDLGADDYVTKPFSPRELAARVRAVLRRRPPADERAWRRGDLVIDPATRSATLAGRTAELTSTEFSILSALARYPGHVRSRAQLLEAAADPDRGTSERAVDVHVHHLRQKLEPDPGQPRYVRTVVGVGYRLDPTGRDT